MAEIEDQNKLMYKTFLWTLNAAKAVADAGGDPKFVLQELPEYVVTTLARNNIHFVYAGRGKDG